MSVNESRIVKALREKLLFDLEEAKERLSNGSQIVSGDAAGTGLNCAKLIGHAHGLRYALNCIEDVEDELFGKAKDKKEKAA